MQPEAKSKNEASKSQDQTPNILQQIHGRISNTNKSVIHPPWKLKKTRLGFSRHLNKLLISLLEIKSSLTLN